MESILGNKYTFQKMFRLIEPGLDCPNSVTKLHVWFRMRPLGDLAIGIAMVIFLVFILR